MTVQGFRMEAGNLLGGAQAGPGDGRPSCELAQVFTPLNTCLCSLLTGSLFRPLLLSLPGVVSVLPAYFHIAVYNPRRGVKLQNSPYQTLL